MYFMWGVVCCSEGQVQMVGQWESLRRKFSLDHSWKLYYVSLVWTSPNSPRTANMIKFSLELHHEHTYLVCIWWCFWVLQDDSSSGAPFWKRPRKTHHIVQHIRYCEVIACISSNWAGNLITIEPTTLRHVPDEMCVQVWMAGWSSGTWIMWVMP